MAKSCPLCGTIFPDSSTFCEHDGTGLRTAEERDDLINHTFCERYVATERLGEGGMGTVYLARDVRLPQKVAIKVNRQPANADKASAARFRQEAEAASRINHDRVARVFDFGFMEDGRPYIVMEYVEGKTLKALLESGPLNPHDAAAITLMIAEALNAAHRLGILHRDLKPENVIILDDTHGGMRLKVLDFGIAKVMGAPDPDVHTKTGLVIGTPLWMSPEQLLGDALDARSDIYALALLAFAMLTGHRAFASDNRQAEVTAPLTSTPHTLQTALPAVAWPAPLQVLLDRTLSRTVADRPASALEFAGELTRIVSAARDPAPAAALPSPSALTAPVAPIASPSALTARGASLPRQPESALPVPGAPPPSQPAPPAPGAPRNQRALYGVMAALSLGVVALAVAVFARTRGNGGNTTNPPIAGVTANSPPALSTQALSDGTAAPPGTNSSTPDSAPTAPVVVGSRDPVAGASRTPGTGASGTSAAGSSSQPAAGIASQPVTGSATRPATTGNAIPAPPAKPGARVNPDSVRNASRPLAERGGGTGVTDEDRLKKLMLESDTAEAGLLSDEFKAARAKQQLRELASLKLTAPLDQGFAWFYRGQAHATLRENDQACAAFGRAKGLAAGSPVLRRNTEEFQRFLNCPL